jgi:hypothetical protein
MSLPQIIPSFPDINLVGGLTYSVQTIGAVEALLFTASPNPDVVVKYDSSVQAVALDLSLAIGFERNVLAKNDSGVVTLGIPHSSFTDKNGEITADCFWRLTGSIVELDIYIGTLTADPTVSATDAPRGSLCVFEDTWYSKDDNGSTTNWSAISEGSGTPWVIGGNTLTQNEILGGSSGNFKVQLQGNGQDFIVLSPDDSAIEVHKQVVPNANGTIALGNAGLEFLTANVREVKAQGALAINSISGPITSEINSVAKFTVASGVNTSANPLAMSAQKITGLAAGTADTDAVNVSQLNSIAAGLDPKESVRICSSTNLVGATYAPAGGTGTTGNFTGVDLTSGAIFDGLVDDNAVGIVLAIGDRILIHNQTDAKQNGIYVVTTAGAAGVIERAADQDGSPANEVSGGNYTFVEGGATCNGTGYVLQGDGLLTLNTDELNWITFSATATEFADKQLSNLTGVTAVPVDLLPVSTAAAIEIGAIGNNFLNMYSNTFTIMHNSGGGVKGGRLYFDNGTGINLLNDKLAFGNASINNLLMRTENRSTDGNTGAVTVTTGNSTGAGLLSGILNLKTGSSTQGNASGEINIESGAHAHTTGASGVVNVKSGTGNSSTNGGTGAVNVESGRKFSGTAGGTGIVTVSSGVAATGTGATGDTRIYTGDNLGTGNSGDIDIETGSSTATRGLITLRAAQDDSRLEVAPSGTESLAIATTGWVNSVLPVASDDWTLAGNATTDPATDYLGTSDAQEMSVRIAATEVFRVYSGGIRTNGSAIDNIDSTELNLRTGDVSGVSAISGKINLVTGDATGTGTTTTGEINIITGNSGTTSSSGRIQMFTGDTAGTAVGGSIVIRTGTASLSAKSGPVTLASGTQSGTNDSGDVLINSGTSVGASGESGSVTIRSNASVSNGGNIALTTGSASAGTGENGTISLRTGDSTGGFRGSVYTSAGGIETKIGPTFAAPNTTDVTSSITSGSVGIAAAFTDLYTQNLADGVYFFDVMACGSNAAADESAMYKRTIHVEVLAGVATIILESSDFTSENVASKPAWDIAIVIDGVTTNQVKFQYKHPAAATVWTFKTVRTLFVNTL